MPGPTLQSLVGLRRGHFGTSLYNLQASEVVTGAVPYCQPSESIDQSIATHRTVDDIGLATLQFFDYRLDPGVAVRLMAIIHMATKARRLPGRPALIVPVPETNDVLVVDEAQLHWERVND